MFSALPMWLWPILASALLLGIYDVTKKAAVRDNPILSVLFGSTFCGMLFFCGLVALRGGFAVHFQCPPYVFGLLFAKSALVGASWACVYYAMRELPISIVSPIRASSPLWTFLGSLVLFGEFPSLIQAAGMLAIFGGYYLFSHAGKLEGISWTRNKGVHAVVAGTLLGAASALYDKYLLNVLGLDRTTVQLHFSIDLVLLFCLVWGGRKLLRIPDSRPFHWRWSIAATGILLILADALYFYAISVPEARISIISLLRRCSCVVSFGIGVVYFREKNIRRKAIALAVILLGVLILALRSR